MKTLFGAAILSVMSVNASAATVTLENGTVQLSGQFAWSAGAGYIDPLRSSAEYMIELPLSGSPFDPEFSPPPDVLQQVPPTIGLGLPVDVGDPQTRDITKSGKVSAHVFNWDTPRDPILRPDNAVIDPQPVLTDQYVGLGGFRYVTDGPNGTSNITNMNFFLNFNEDYSQLLSISATQVIESSIFVPLPEGNTISELGVLVALGIDAFDPINVTDVSAGR